jgi:hypothetical protein
MLVLVAIAAAALLALTAAFIPGSARADLPGGTTSADAPGDGSTSAETGAQGDRDSDPSDGHLHQVPYGVDIEEHGTFVVVDFKTLLPEEHAGVVLQNVVTGKLEWAEDTSDPAKTKWSIVVDELAPGAEHSLAIYAGDQGYSLSQTVTTLTRQVSVTIADVEMMDDADDDFLFDNCGDFTFAFRAFAPDSGQDETWFDQDMCADTSWPSYMFVPLELTDVTDSAVSVQVFAVDKDCGVFGCPVIKVEDWDDLGAYDPWGPWATETKAIGVTPDPSTPLDEEITRSFSIDVIGSGGEPQFSVSGSLTVTYS